MSTSIQDSTINVIVRDYRERPFWEAKFRCDGRQAKLRIGPAWLARPGSPAAKPNGKAYKRGEWVQRRGRPSDGWFSYDDAVALAPTVVSEYLQEKAEALGVADAEARDLTHPATFRELARAWREYLDRKGTKPSTLAGYDAMLAEPGIPYKRGEGTTVGYIMAALGNTQTDEVSVSDIEMLLATIGQTGATPRTVEKHRIMVRSILNHGIRQTKRARAGKGGADGHDYGLTVNAASVAEGPHRSAQRTLVYYLPKEIEGLAASLEAGFHRRAIEHHERGCGRSERRPCDCTPDYRVGLQRFADRDPAEAYLRDHRDESQLRADIQDAAAVRVSAYTGLRLGELLALRWVDVDWSGSALTVSRAISARQEATTKSDKVRRVPLPDQAREALTRLSGREDFTAPSELVFCNVATGRPIDDSALRRRYKEAQSAAVIHALRWHDLRHTYGSLLAASGEELVTIKAAMGHANITTTEVYLHARPATELAARFTAAFSATGDRSQTR